MTNPHLSDIEFVDLLDARLSSERAAHATSCERCGARARELQTLLEDARGVEMPEPSPLFWQHFPARVRDRVADVDSAAGERGVTAWRWAFGLCGAVVVNLLIAAGALVWSISHRPPAPPDAGQPPGVARVQEQPAEQPALETAPGDADWQLVVTVAAGVAWDEAGEAGLGVHPGAAERAALQLTPDEQRELARLLRAELGQARIPL